MWWSFGSCALNGSRCAYSRVSFLLYMQICTVVINQFKQRPYCVFSVVPCFFSSAYHLCEDYEQTSPAASLMELHCKAFLFFTCSIYETVACIYTPTAVFLPSHLLHICLALQKFSGSCFQRISTDIRLNSRGNQLHADIFIGSMCLK